jgi:hypothetical protein
MTAGVAASSCQLLIQFSNSQTVIASEATKQSILPLRGEMDCFASLAMTRNSKHDFTTSPRHAPEPLINLSPKEGVGNAGCPLHPRPRGRTHTSNNEYTGITRHPRTQWF